MVVSAPHGVAGGLRLALRISLAVACGTLAPPPATAGTVATLSERGPSTFLVGAVFTLASPVSLAVGAVTGGRVKIHACRFGHGLVMVPAGAVLLPLGLLASPFNARRLPDAWLDGAMESFEEDACSRPLTSVIP